MSQAIDNSGLLNYRHTGTEGFTPSIAYAYDAAAKTVKVTDASTIPNGDTLKIIHLKVHDVNGDEVRGDITATGADGAQSLDVSNLDQSRGLNLTATVLTTKMLAADGIAVSLQAAGTVGKWDKQQNA